MKSFRSLEEIKEAPLAPQTRTAAEQAMHALLEAYGEDYDPDDCGYVVVVGPETTNADAMELMGRTWTDACFEGVSFDKEANCFLTCWLANNQYGHTILIPDEPWLDSAFRRFLVAGMGDSSEI